MKKKNKQRNGSKCLVIDQCFNILMCVHFLSNWLGKVFSTLRINTTEEEIT